MPTNTVKDVFVSPEPPNIGSILSDVGQQLRRLFSKKVRVSSAGKILFTACALLGGAILSNLKAQTLNARLSITSTTTARIKIDARLPNATTVLSFRNTYAGVLGLGERIETVEGIRDNGARVRLQKLTSGEFQSVEKLSRFVYEVNLAGPRRPADLSHISSLNSDYGVLMMSDLLPQSTVDGRRFASAVIKLEAPKGWTVASNAREEGSQFVTASPDTAVFLIGSSLHEKRQRFTTSNFSIVASGKWSFSDGDATKIAGEILEEYARITRFQLKSNVMLMLVPYSEDAGPESWSAETRGNVVVLSLGPKAKRKAALARLGIVLSHELFHLWVPNSLKLEGDYDWFFEGFTLYQALRMDLRLGLISFDDYLETLARVYDSYRSYADRDRLSLIEASQRRWTTSGSQVYEKGMLAAFIYDLKLRKLTDCRASLDNVYADLFRSSATGQRSANEIIIGVLSGREGMKTFAHDYVESALRIDLAAVLPSYGIQTETSQSGATQLVPVGDPGEAQRDLLRCIGYRK